jgi:hypothetical protein
MGYFYCILFIIYFLLIYSFLTSFFIFIIGYIIFCEFFRFFAAICLRVWMTTAGKQSQKNRAGRAASTACWKQAVNQGKSASTGITPGNCFVPSVFYNGSKQIYFSRGFKCPIL